MTTDVTYTLTVTPNGMTVYITRRAGICGPADTTDTVPATLDAAAEWAATCGFDVTGPWRLTSAYEGLWVETDLTRRDTSAAEQATTARIIEQANDNAATRVAAAATRYVITGPAGSETRARLDAVESGKYTYAELDDLAGISHTTYAAVLRPFGYEGE
jgi:hypothetical protein